MVGSRIEVCLHLQQPQPQFPSSSFCECAEARRGGIAEAMRAPPPLARPLKDWLE